MDFVKEMSMRKGILLAAVISLITAGLVYAQEGELTGTIDITYLSSYIWRGFDCYAEDHSAVQPSIDLDLWGSGFGLKVMSSRAIHSGFEDKEELDFTLYYKDLLCEAETYATFYELGYVYYNFPDNPKKGSATLLCGDMQEIFLALAWPNVCPAGIVPSYVTVLMWPSEGKSYSKHNGGWAHILGLDYAWTIPGLMPETPEQVLNLHAEMVYNDGVGPAGEAVDNDWSHAVFGVSTDFEVAENLTFTPVLYYQSSWDDSVNTQDETWVSLSMAYKF